MRVILTNLAERQQRHEFKKRKKAVRKGEKTVFDKFLTIETEKIERQGKEGRA